MFSRHFCCFTFYSAFFVLIIVGNVSTDGSARCQSPVNFNFTSYWMQPKGIGSRHYAHRNQRVPIRRLFALDLDRRTGPLRSCCFRSGRLIHLAFLFDRFAVAVRPVVRLFAYTELSFTLLCRHKTKALPKTLSPSSSPSSVTFLSPSLNMYAKQLSSCCVASKYSHPL